MSETRTQRLLGGIAVAYRDRNFRIYSAGSIASWTSYFIQLVAVSWLTWELTGSTGWLAAMALFDIVPTILLMPFTGAVADRFDRHVIMIWTCVLCLVHAIGLAVLSSLGWLTIAPLAALQVVHAVLIAFMVPAMYGTLPRFVGRDALPSAIAVSSSYVQVAVFAGPAFAGWLISAFSVTWAFAVNAIGYAILTAAFSALRTPDGYRQPEPEPESVLSSIGSGARYLVADGRILNLLIVGIAFQGLVKGFYHMMPAYSELVLGMGVGGMSAVLAAEGLGATAAALWLARKPAGSGASLVPDERVFRAALAGIICVVVLVHVSDLYAALALGVSLGVFAEIRKVGTMTIVQTTVDERQRGRVMGTWYMMSQMAAGIGAFGIGWAATRWGLGGPFLAAGVVALLVWLWCRVHAGRLSNPVR